MTVTAIILMVMIAGMLAYIVYDELIVPFLKGKNVLSVKLRKRNYIDKLIFAGLLVVLFLSNKMRGGDNSVNVLLLVMTAIFLYYVFVRSPKARFKEKGFFYGFFFTEYDHVKSMKLSEDGVLVIETGRRRMLLYAKKIEDLENILNVFVKQ